MSQINLWKKNKPKRSCQAWKGFYLFILNEDMNDIIKTIKSEDSGALIDGVSETVKHEMKKQ